MIESDNLSSFDRPLDILTTWIGLLLISAGITLAVLAGVIRESRRARIGASVLGAGISLALAFTLYSVGAPASLLAGPALALLCITAAYILTRKASNGAA